jgi:hypothetical protein
MYKPSLLFDRTPEERRDPFLFWKRKDQPFFAAGACHILAEMFCRLHYGEGYELIYIKPKDGKPGTHVYASNGTWAFDHNGWTKENELLKITSAAYEQRYPGWGYERIVIKDDLETFCRKNNCRQPWQFAHLPWERAYNYIKQFASAPH